jgi:acyl carrier protein
MKAESSRDAPRRETSEEQPASDRGRLVKILHNLGFRHVTADDDLLELGLSSAKIVQLSVDIEGEFGVPVDLATLLAAPTLGELEAQLTTTESSNSGRE